MFFKQLATKESSLSYFFGCGSLGKAVAVDVVAGDEEWFLEEAAKANVKITHVIDTPVHAERAAAKKIGEGRFFGRQLLEKQGYLRSVSDFEIKA